MLAQRTTLCYDNETLDTHLNIHQVGDEVARSIGELGRRINLSEQEARAITNAALEVVTDYYQEAQARIVRSWIGAPSEAS